MPRPINWTVTLPKCDFCGKPAKFDGKTTLGPWANMCDFDLQLNGYPNSNELTFERTTISSNANPSV